MDKKKTYGQMVVDNWNTPVEDDVIEYRRAMEPEIWDNIVSTAEKAAAHPLYRNKDFYVVLLTKVERIGHAVRTFALARQSCPTPVYQQAVWKYHRDTGALEFLWSIPDKILYYYILNNKQKVLADKECAETAKFVILMESGELLEWVKRENFEKKDAVIKINTDNEIKNDCLA
jgi:hypothetical protein